MEKYSKLSFAIMLSLLIFAITFSLSIQDTQTPPKSDIEQINTAQTQSMQDTKEKADKYLLRLSGNTLTAYRISSGTKSVLEKAEIEISSLTSEDIINLENGVYADSPEELLLYYESYTS